MNFKFITKPLRQLQTFVMEFEYRLRCIIAYPILLIFDILICLILNESFKDLREESNGKLEQLWNKKSV